MVDSNQILTKQKHSSEPILSIPKVDVFSSLGEGEGIKEGGKLTNGEPFQEKFKNSVRSDVEWKKVEGMLSHLGLQSIQSTNKDFLEGSLGTASRKKGIRELQNLKFNVNYDRGGCSRGTQSSP